MKWHKGKAIVIADRATGIGSATAQRLGSKGACVLICDINLSGVK